MKVSILANIKPFKAFRPINSAVDKIAALPYDVMDREEARDLLKKSPLSFIKVTKSDATLPDSIDQYDDKVYTKAAENIKSYLTEGLMFIDDKPCFYIYKQKMNDHIQIGLVAAASVEEYEQGIIKKHELTRPDKEDDRVNHIKSTNAQTGAVFLTYKKSDCIDELIAEIISRTQPVYDFVADDNIEHTFYLVSNDSDIEKIQEAFKKINYLYIADGHHRSAAASRVKNMYAKDNDIHTGNEEYNYFLSVIFPHDMMQILDYNRVVKDLNNLSKEEFFKKVEVKFTVEQCKSQYKPENKELFAMYIDGIWYKLSLKEKPNTEDIVKSLAVSILQDNLLAPILDIKDPRTDKRINFVGGIRGLKELEKNVDNGNYAVAFALYPTSIEELMHVADENKIMPPKSTWFEPKLRDAMAVHLIGKID